jgi:flagellin
MVLDNTQTITLFANGNTVDMTMESADSVDDFRRKLNDSMLELGLGSGDPTIDENLVRYVTQEDAQASGNIAVAGTFVFQAGVAGDSSNVQFIGDQGVINALSIAQIQQSENAELDVTVTDAHNGMLIGQDRISDNILRGVIEGVDVQVSNPKLVTSYNSTAGKISFSAPAEPIEMDLHVVDNRTAVQIGANEGQTIDVSIGEMNTTALEIDDAYVTNFAESQKAITKFDQALQKVSGSRATIGAQVNRLQYTMQNLAVSKMNLVASESRIRDLDVAEESATFAKNQVLVNSAIAMLAQANAMPGAALQLIG